MNDKKHQSRLFEDENAIIIKVPTVEKSFKMLKKGDSNTNSRGRKLQSFYGIN